MPTETLKDLLAYARTKGNLTPELERRCYSDMKGDDPRLAKLARDKLVEHNMRLAFKLARAWEGCGLPQEDLVQEALVGLNIAVDKFDPDRGRFTTYATRWIRKCLWDAAYGTSDTIKKPSRLSRTAVAVYEYVRRNPTASLEEVSESIGRPEQEVREAFDHARVVASTSDEEFHEVAESELEETESALTCLDPEEREAISWKHGLYGLPRSLDDVAKMMNQDVALDGSYTAKDVARLCRSATRKLRAARRSDDDVICSTP